MGGDGGTLIGRDVMVKTKQRAKVEVDPFLVTHEQLSHCAVSGSELSRPIVACELGFLYNKDAIISHLLSKHDNPKLRHIRGVRDLIDCNVVLSSDKRPTASANTAVRTSLDTASVSDSQRRAMEGNPPPTLVCPVMQVDADGKVPFIVMRDCGCVLSLRAYTELAKGEAKKTCLVCERAVPGKYWGEGAAADALVEGELAYIPLCGGAATMATLRDVMEKKRALEAERKGKKKDKKEKKDKRGLDDADEDGARKRAKEDKGGPVSVTSLATQAILAEAAENVRKMQEQSSAYNSLFRKE